MNWVAERWYTWAPIAGVLLGMAYGEALKQDFYPYPHTHTIYPQKRAAWQWCGRFVPRCVYLRLESQLWRGYRYEWENPNRPRPRKMSRDELLKFLNER